MFTTNKHLIIVGSKVPITVGECACGCGCACVCTRVCVYICECMRVYVYVTCAEAHKRNNMIALQVQTLSYLPNNA